MKKTTSEKRLLEPMIKTQFCIRLAPELVERLRRQAKKRELKTSSYITFMLVAGLLEDEREEK